MDKYLRTNLKTVVLFAWRFQPRIDEVSRITAHLNMPNKTVVVQLHNREIKSINGNPERSAQVGQHP